MSQFIAFDIVRAVKSQSGLPKKIDLKPSPGAVFFLAAMLLPALASAIIVPYFLSAFLSLSNRNFSAYILDNPLIAAELFLASLLLAALFVYLAVQFLTRLGKNRTVWLSAKNVTIRERGPFGTRAWWFPISEFKGIAHYVRSTISEQRFELVLVHTDPACSVLLHVGQSEPRLLMQEYCAHFGMAEIEVKHLRHRDSAAVMPAILPALAPSTPINT